MFRAREHNLLPCKILGLKTLMVKNGSEKKSRLRFFRFSNVFFHVLMYFQFSKKVVDQIFKCNIVLFERYISKCPNVSEKM